MRVESIAVEIVCCDICSTYYLSNVVEWLTLIWGRQDVDKRTRTLWVVVVKVPYLYIPFKNTHHDFLSIPLILMFMNSFPFRWYSCLWLPFHSVDTHVYDVPFHSVDTHVYDFPFHSVDTHVYDIETLYIHFVILLRPDIRHFRYESKLI